MRVKANSRPCYFTASIFSISVESEREWFETRCAFSRKDGQHSSRYVPALQTTGRASRHGGNTTGWSGSRGGPVHHADDRITYEIASANVCNYCKGMPYRWIKTTQRA